MSGKVSYCFPGVQFIYKRVQTGPTSWLAYSWLKVQKKPVLSNITGSFSAGYIIDFPDGICLDVYQKSSNPYRVAASIYSSGNDGGNNLNYPKLFVNELILQGDSGDLNNILLKLEVNASASPQTITAYIYSILTKEVTVINFPLYADYCIDAFSVPDTTIIYQKCNGTTLQRYYHDGNGGVTLVETADSDICGYVAPVPEIRVTEKLSVEIKNCDVANPVFLVWKNSLGGWDSWVFGRTQTIKDNVDTLGKYRQDFGDISTISNPVHEIGRISTPSMILGADNLTPDQRIGISGILKSNRIYLCSADLLTRQEVNINTGSFPIETIDTSDYIEFEIILPEDNLLSN